MGTAPANILTLVLVAAASAGDATVRVAAEQSADDRPKLPLALRAQPESEPTAWCGSGETVRVLLSGADGETVRWQLGADATVLHKGRAELDADGRGKLLFAMPQTPRRLELTLLAAGGGKARGRIVVVPTSMLSESVSRLAALGVGVVDASGAALELLEPGGKWLSHLKSRLQRDRFDGGVVLLAGFEKPDALAAECRRLDDRVRDGMCAIVWNPPDGWMGWELSVERVENPADGTPRFAKGFARALHASDLGDGPWGRQIAGGADARMLCLPPKPDAPDPAKKKHGARGLIAARRRGRGWVVASVAASTKRGDAVERCLLAETLLWVLDHAGEREDKESES